VPIVGVCSVPILESRTSAIVARRVVNVPGKTSGNDKRWQPIPTIGPTSEIARKDGTGVIPITGASIGGEGPIIADTIDCCRRYETIGVG
jgi:hypothetical protein